MRDRRQRQAKCPRRKCSMKNGFTPSIVMLGCRPIKSSHGRATFMKRLSIIAAGLLIGAAAVQFSGVASGQDGWITLLDSTKMGDWTEVGKANWAMKDGALVADKLDDAKVLSYLVSKNSYKDFQIKAEF